jgi:hypothetical protein
MRPEADGGFGMFRDAPGRRATLDAISQCIGVDVAPFDCAPKHVIQTRRTMQSLPWPRKLQAVSSKTDYQFFQPS